jgi:hypothetical protein
MDIIDLDKLESQQTLGLNSLQESCRSAFINAVMQSLFEHIDDEFISTLYNVYDALKAVLQKAKEKHIIYSYSVFCDRCNNSKLDVDDGAVVAWVDVKEYEHSDSIRWEFKFTIDKSKSIEGGKVSKFYARINLFSRRYNSRDRCFNSSWEYR